VKSILAAATIVIVLVRRQIIRFHQRRERALALLRVTILGFIGTPGGPAQRVSPERIRDLEKRLKWA
jgi:hypothetical protein